MKLLMVSTWPPMACGVGKYAEQQVAHLKREGHVVEVLSPPPGDGDFRQNLFGGLRPLRLLKFAWAYDAVWIHYTQHFFFHPQNKFDRLLTSLAWLAVMLLAGRRISTIVHETDSNPDDSGPLGLRSGLDRWFWRLAHRLVFHSERERAAFCRHYRIRRGPQQEVWPHEQFFQRHCDLDREAARGRLHLDPAHTILLCIGFIQPHKGFDRVIRAMADVKDAARLRLKIVGSVRIEWDQALSYMAGLHELAARDPRCEVIETWISDEIFDTWLAAADYVVLPYRQVWSSGVAARAKLYGRPLLAADIGGLGEQLTEGSLLFENDEELVGALRQIAGRAGECGVRNAERETKLETRNPKLETISKFE